MNDTAPRAELKETSEEIAVSGSGFLRVRFNLTGSGTSTGASTGASGFLRGFDLDGSGASGASGSTSAKAVSLRGRPRFWLPFILSNHFYSAP